MRGQAAKYLLKGFDASTLPGVMENMGKHENVVEHEEVCYSEGEDLLAGDALGDIFDFRAATLTRTVYEAVKVLQLASRDSRRRICMCCSFASRREHIEAFLLGEFVNKLKRLPASSFQIPASTPPTVKTILSKLISLFGLTTVADPLSPFASSFLEYGYITNTHLS
jgi:acyl-CoA oxidase